MIPNTQLRESHADGVQDTTSFGISEKDSAHVMGILRDTLYTDKVLAPLREYSANAWDEHRQAGKGDLPIKVTLPTDTAPALTIRDFGRGLSHEDVFQVFTQYGASTKRGTNVAVGQLGIGSKSGFAYSDTFTVTSWNGGKKRVYAAVLDPSDVGEMKLLYEGDCGEETGLQIQIPVQPKDIREFQTKAEELFRYFNPRPDVNATLPRPAPGKKMACGEIYDATYAGWVAVMGCIAYRVNVNQLAGVKGFDQQMFGRISGALYFEIGEVQVNASREELKYSDGTKRALVEKLNALVDEYVHTTLAAIQGSQFTPWEKRLKAQVLNRLGLPVPSDAKELFASSVAIKEPPKTFTLLRGKNVASSVSVEAETRLLLGDDRRSLRGFLLHGSDYVVRPVGKAALVEVERELGEVLEKVGATGVKIENLSTLPWTAPLRGGRSKNAKHRARSFKLIPGRHYCHPWSENWEREEEREADPSDVYVILNNFKAKYNFYETHARDKRVAQVLDLKLPAIYGYKSTMAKPVVQSDCVGVEYLDWRKTFLAGLNTPKATALVGYHRWHVDLTGGSYYNYSYRSAADVEQKEIDLLVKFLGEGHLVTRFAMKCKEARDYLVRTAVDAETVDFLNREVVPRLPDPKKSECKLATKEIEEAYPMLKLSSVGLTDLWGNEARIWLGYVNLVDNHKKKEG